MSVRFGFESQPAGVTAEKLAEWLRTHPQWYKDTDWHRLAEALLQAFPLRSEGPELPSVEEPLAHSSDCAMHSEPAYPNGACDCQPKLSSEVQDTILKYYGMVTKDLASLAKDLLSLRSEGKALTRAQLVTTLAPYFLSGSGTPGVIADDILARQGV